MRPVSIDGVGADRVRQRHVVARVLAVEKAVGLRGLDDGVVAGLEAVAGDVFVDDGDGGGGGTADLGDDVAAAGGRSIDHAQPARRLIQHYNAAGARVIDRVQRVPLTAGAAHQQANNVPTTDAFSAYSFDAWLVFVDAAKRALAKAQPGTPEFKTALRDAIVSTANVTGTHGVYNFKLGDNFGVDERARVLVKLTKGAWTLMP